MYIFHTDPGHGWLAVKRSELKRLGIIDKISSYSYQKGQTVYLEEDCDATIFCQAKEAKGEKIEVKESYKKHTPIRHYPCFYCTDEERDLFCK
ncbi:MAG: hypothetical protein ACOCUT_00115 [bacterium]